MGKTEDIRRKFMAMIECLMVGNLIEFSDEKNRSDED